MNRRLKLIAALVFILPVTVPGVAAIDLDPGDPGGGGGGPAKYALIVGIGDYKNNAFIDDIPVTYYSALEWYDFFEAKGYHILWLGDNQQTMAYESTIKSFIQYFAGMAQNGDVFALVLLGHGGNFAGTFYCTYEYTGLTGKFYDSELANELDGFNPLVSRFVFADCCHSGGMGPELMGLSSKPYIYCAAAAHVDQYGYYDADGFIWTSEFLTNELAPHPTWSVEYTFDQATLVYPDMPTPSVPEEFDGNPSYGFYL